MCGRRPQDRQRHSADASHDGLRLDVCLVRLLHGISRAELQRWVRSGRVLLNGVHPRTRARVKAGDLIEVDPPPPPSTALIGQELSLCVLYEDGDLLVLNKPAGMAVHPGAGRRTGTVANALMGRGGALSDVRGELRPGIVHRLDRDTSGVLLVAKNNAAHEGVARQFRERRVEKTYRAVAQGIMSPAQGTVDAPIGRSPHHRKKMAIRPDGKPSVTDYRVLEKAGPYSLVELKPRTGRTHQIRVHLQLLGHPILCDALYSRRSRLFFRDLPGKSEQPDRILCERLALHACSLGVDHPNTGERLLFCAPWPQDLDTAWSGLSQAYREGDSDG